MQSCIPQANRLACLFANLSTKSIFHVPFPVTLGHQSQFYLMKDRAYETRGALARSFNLTLLFTLQTVSC